MRRCIFCNGEIDAKAPPEHVISKWIRRLYPKGAVFTLTRRDGRSFRSKTIDITVDTVCGDCNHHWMSDLESHASPIVGPMLKGGTQGLSVEQQALVATWATKTAMTLDQSYTPSERVFTPEQCKWPMQHKLPLPGVIVQLGRYVGTGDFLAIAHNDLYRTAIPVGTSPGAPDASRSIIRLDQLVMEVTVTEDAELDLRATGANIGDVLIKIWPSVAAAVWPPRHDFNDQSWAAFVTPDLPDASGQPSM